MLITNGEVQTMSRKERYSKEDRKKALEKQYTDSKKGSGIWYLKEEDDLDYQKLTPKAGKVYLGILPRPDSPVFFQELFVHYNVGPNNYAFLCPNKMYGKQCPVCDYRKQLEDDGESDDVLRQYRWTVRVLLWVVDMDNKRTIADGVFLYDGPNTVLRQIQSLSMDDRTGEMLDISDPDEDACLEFKRIGEGMHTKYEGFKLGKRIEEIPGDYEEDTIPMDELLIEPDIEEMDRALGLGARKVEKVEKTSKRDRDEDDEVDDVFPPEDDEKAKEALEDERDSGDEDGEEKMPWEKNRKSRDRDDAAEEEPEKDEKPVRRRRRR